MNHIKYSDTDGKARQRRIAQQFNPDPLFEQMQELREKDPAAYALYSASAKMSLGFYLQQKETYLAERNEGASHEL